MNPPAKPEAPAVSRPRMLSDVVRDKLRAGHYSRRTEEAYLGWIRRFIKFHGARHPRELGESDLVAFLKSLAVAGGVAAATQNQALNALMFIYTQVLELKLGLLGKFARASRRVRLPVGLTPAGVRSLLAEMTITHLLARRLVVVILWKIAVVFQGQRVV